MKTFAILAVAVCVGVMATDVINCATGHDCPDVIRCDPTQDCMITCTGDQSCQQRKVYCPQYHSCSISCEQHVNSTAEWDDDPNQFCQQSDFYLPLNGTFKMICSGDEACEESTLIGQCNSANCTIACSGDDACSRLTCHGSGCP